MIGVMTFSSFCMNRLRAAGEPPNVHLAGSRSLAAAMRVHATGDTYANFMPDEHGREVTEAYPPATLERLRAIKAAFDPHNRFRMNHNIRPATKD